MKKLFFDLIYYLNGMCQKVKITIWLSVKVRGGVATERVFVAHYLRVTKGLWKFKIKIVTILEFV